MERLQSYDQDWEEFRRILDQTNAKLMLSRFR